MSGEQISAHQIRSSHLRDLALTSRASWCGRGRRRYPEHARGMADALISGDKVRECQRGNLLAYRKGE